MVGGWLNVSDCRRRLGGNQHAVAGPHILGSQRVPQANVRERRLEPRTFTWYILRQDDDVRVEFGYYRSDLRSRRPSGEGGACSVTYIPGGNAHVSLASATAR